MESATTSIPGVVFAFFGWPGAGKSTLCRRFGELNHVPALDTDAFMTAPEVEAVEAGRYTREMREANIRRYAAQVGDLLTRTNRVALADGLPDEASREFLRSQLRPAKVVFVLVKSPRELWERRLRARTANAVAVGVEKAEAYVREHWQPVPPWFDHEAVENGEDPSAVDAALLDLYARDTGAGAGGDRRGG